MTSARWVCPRSRAAESSGGVILLARYVNVIQEHSASEPGSGRSQQQVTLDDGTTVIGDSPNNCERQTGMIAGCRAGPGTFPPGSP